MYIKKKCHQNNFTNIWHVPEVGRNLFPTGETIEEE